MQLFDKSLNLGLEVDPEACFSNCVLILQMDINTETTLTSHVAGCFEGCPLFMETLPNT